jgi:Spy/CpxP family protein refolding chaperone
VAPHRAANGLDGRVQLLAKELDLDEHQQAEVRKILLQQREEVKQAWSNPSVPSEVRIATMRAAGDRTAARIRAILNDSQRERYIKARPATPDHPQPASELDSWIGAVGKP